MKARLGKWFIFFVILAALFGCSKEKETKLEKAEDNCRLPVDLNCSLIPCSEQAEDQPAPEWVIEILREHWEMADCFEMGIEINDTGKLLTFGDEEFTVVTFEIEQKQNKSVEYTLAVAPSGLVYVYDVNGAGWLTLAQFGKILATSVDDLLGSWLLISWETEGTLYTAENESYQTKLSFYRDNDHVLWAIYEPMNAEGSKFVPCLETIDEPIAEFNYSTSWHIQIPLQQDVSSYISLTDRDRLLLENHYELDGTPAVSRQFYMRESPD